MLISPLLPTLPGQDGYLIRHADITSVPIPYESTRFNTQGTIFIRPFLDPKPAGPLQRRAWTLQEETFSRRCLYLTKNCLVWVCLESLKSEKDFHPWAFRRGLIQQVFTKHIHSTSPMKIEDFKREPGDTMHEWYTLYLSILIDLSRLGEIDSLLSRLSLNLFTEKLDYRIRLACGWKTCTKDCYGRQEVFVAIRNGKHRVGAGLPKTSQVVQSGQGLTQKCCGSGFPARTTKWRK